MDNTKINLQLERIAKGFPWLEIEAPATPGHGIEILDADAAAAAESYYNENGKDVTKCKFVPASGAASRMFKDIFAGADKPNDAVRKLAAELESFAFYSPEVFGEAPFDPSKVAHRLLDADGLGYGSKPKGVLKFHKVDGQTRTPVAEHMIEAASYMKDSGGKAAIEFTISPEHRQLFKDAVDEVRKAYEDKFGTEYEIRFSCQDKDTDTVAMAADGTAFRKDDGTILFRPAGHGALIYNLNALREELVSIKNIDNVSARNLEITATWKRILMGRALQLRDRIFEFICTLDQMTALRKGLADFAYIPAYNMNQDDPYATPECQELCNEIEQFLKDELCVEIPEPKDCRDRAELLRAKLDRPIRVCGMVRNEGEPGGGPFIVRSKDGSTSLQILEGAQINPGDPAATDALRAATHFNPVDLVCCIHDHKGDKFDLLKYVDEETGFISSKSFQGRELKALELPGLWNGSMSDWNTLFVEVPAETFNPVKTVLDLLRPAHQ